MQIQILFFLLAIIYSTNARAISNCELLSQNRLNCLRCTADYILSENKCHLRNQTHDPNCLELTKFGDCMICECGFSLEVFQNLCMQTPENLIGCQVFRFSNEPECLRPKQEFELLKSQTTKQFLSVEFSNYSNCEIRFLENMTKCEQCHSGFQLDEVFSNCIEFTETLSNVYYSYFDKQGNLLSRDFRFIAFLESGVYQLIDGCITHSFNLTTQQVECELCTKEKIPNESFSLCVKPPFLNCGIVFDSDIHRCKQCIDSTMYFIQNSNKCVLRKHTLIGRCSQYEKTSNLCLKCNPPFILIASLCVHPAEIDKTIQEIQTLNKMTHCAYAVTSTRCLECEFPYIIDQFGYCNERFEFPNCQLYDSVLHVCIQCNPGFIYINQNCLKIDQNHLNHCSYSKIVPGKQSEECQSCFAPYQLDTYNNCILITESCSYPGRLASEGCLQCNNLYYIFKDGSRKKCEKISESEFCIFSDGYNNRCQVCHRLFELSSEGKCESRIEHNDQRCEYEYSYFVHVSDKYCTPHNFFGNHNCIEFHPRSNTCVRCLEGSYVTVLGECNTIPDCEISNGIDNYCLLAFMQRSYISDGKVQINPSDNYCQTNQRDDICYPCQYDSKRFGLHLRNEKETCIPDDDIDEKVRQNCIAVSRNTQNHIQTNYVCSLCQNLFFIQDFDGTCAQISEYQTCNLSDGIHNECLSCGDFRFGKYLLRYSFNKELKECENPNRQFVQYCTEYLEGICVKCQALFFISWRKEILICLPIQYPNCEYSDGIHNKCTNCIDYTYYLYNDCLVNPCTAIDQETRTCTDCAEGYHLTQTEYLGNICVSDFDVICFERNMNGDCLSCRIGYYQMINQDNLIECYKITHQHCLQLNSNLSQHRCILCEMGYFVSDKGNCLPENNRCEEFSPDRRCLKCKSSFFLSQFQTCEAIESCLTVNERNCVQCKSGFYLSGDKSQCIKIQNCSHSLGIHNFCLVCEPFYELKNSFCFHQNPTDNCEKYHGLECIQCLNFFYLAEQQSEIKQNQSTTPMTCKPISSKNCKKSSGLLDKCDMCETTGYILHKIDDQQQCVKLNKCSISDGMEHCLQCEDGYYSQLENFSSEKLTTCEKQIMIPNCEIYSKTSQECEKCENGYLSKYNENIKNPESYPVCLKMFLNKQINCYQEKAESKKCISCEEGYLQIQTKFLDMNQCKQVTLSQRGCHLFLTVQGCNQCQSEYYLEVFEPQKQSFNDYQNNFQLIGKCIYRTQQLETGCREYSIDSDTCQSCQNGYFFIPGKEYCVKIEEQQQVKHCETYYENSLTCLKCQQQNNNEYFVEYWLDKKANACVNVSELMCRVMKENVKECKLQGFISKCQIYDELNTQTSKCILCENGFFLNEGICQEHSIIPFCLKYHSFLPNQCIECIDQYLLVDTSASCIRFQEIEHCAVYNRSIYKMSCQICNDPFKSDSETGLCVQSDIENCVSIQIINPNNTICVKCSNSDRYQWNQTTKKCEIIPHKIKINCLEFSIKKQCQKCRDGFILNANLQCISIQQRCQIQNCQEYSKQSSPDKLICEQCYNGFSIESAINQCILSKDTQKYPKQLNDDLDTKNEEIIKEKQKIDEQKIGESNIYLTIFTIVIFCLLLGLGLTFIYRRFIKQRQDQHDPIILIDEKQNSSVIEIPSHNSMNE